MLNDPTTTLITDGRFGPDHEFGDIEPFDASQMDNRAEQILLPNDTDLESLRLRLPSLRTILIDFPAFTDGRGFSLARQLRTIYNYQGRLIANGPLIPDQYLFALQCGFDGVRIGTTLATRHTDTAWAQALEAFQSTYQRGYTRSMGASSSIFDARATSPEAALRNDPYYGLSAERALKRALDEYSGKITLASSLGADSAALLHMIAQIDKNIPIIFLDTGKHFRETLSYRDHLVESLGLTNFQNIIPDPEELAHEDPEGKLNQTDPDSCCDLRKVRPLDRVIAQYEARITGRKRYQTPDRADMPILELGGRQVKVNPLAYWSAKDVTAYIRRHDLPPHPMFALGYLSIGCQPCTTRVAEGEDPRAGRWRNSDKTECGIHYIDGKWVSVPTQKTHEVF